MSWDFRVPQNEDEEREEELEPPDYVLEDWPPSKVDEEAFQITKKGAEMIFGKVTEIKSGATRVNGKRLVTIAIMSHKGKLEQFNSFDINDDDLQLDQIVEISWVVANPDPKFVE